MPRRRKGLALGKKGETNNAGQRQKKHQAASLRAERLETIVEEPEDGEEATVDSPQTVEQPPRKKQRQVHTTWAEQTLKRSTIQYFYERLGCPPVLEWDGAGGVVLQIRDLMVLPVGQKHTKTIRRVLHAILDGDTYDPAARTPRDGKKHKLSEAEKRIAADCLIDGMGQWQAMYNVNAWRARRKLDPVSRTGRRATRALALHKDAKDALEALHTKWDTY